MKFANLLGLPRDRLPADTKHVAEVIELRRAGLKFREIQKRTGIPHGTCQSIWQRHGLVTEPMRKKVA